MCSKLIFKIENGNIQTGNGNISPTSRPLIKKRLLQDISNCSKVLKINHQNRKWNHPNRKWNFFSYFQPSDQKTSFTKYSLFVPMFSKLIFKAGNWSIQTEKGIISLISRASDPKTSFKNVVYMFQGFKN